MGNGIGMTKQSGDISYQDILALKKMFKTLTANRISINFSYKSPVFYRDNRAMSLLDIANTKATYILKMFKTGSCA
jgi:hypothetical protein